MDTVEFDRKAHASREADILIKAANERRELNKMKLPGEPVIKDKPVRLDNDGLQESIGGLLGRYGQQIAETEKKAEPKPDESWKRDLPAGTATKKAHDYRA